MESLTEKINSIDWQNITGEMNEKGFAIVPDLLSDEQCNELIANSVPAVYMFE